MEELKSEHRACVGSTNTILKENADMHSKEDFLLSADRQTTGRGRMGRSFFSPDGGLYFSLLVHPEESAENSLFLTTLMAVAVSSAVSEVCGVKCGIKWVNDIYLDGKKICGILTEGKIGEGGKLDYAVIGAGINIEEPKAGFPEEISGVAGAVYEYGCAPEGIRKSLLDAVCRHFYAYYRKDAGAVRGRIDRGFLSEYRSRSCIIGKKIFVSENYLNNPPDYFGTDGARKALALEIDEECRLLVQYDDGEKRLLSNGEVRIRL